MERPGQSAACEQCGAGLPAGVTGPLCDACVLGTPRPAQPQPVSPVVAAYNSGAGRADRRRRPRHVRPAPVGTWAVMAAMLVFFAILKTSGSGDDFLTLTRWIKSNEQIWHGELWRFVTPIFVHFDWPHLVGNLVLLYLFGPQLEVLVGTPRFLAIFLTAGVSGVVASFRSLDELSAGASGGVFGIFGGILAFLATNRTSMRHLRTRDVALCFVWMIALVALTSVLPVVDNWAHVGGLAGGFLCGLMLVPRLPGLVPKPRLRWAGGVVLVVLVAIGAVQGYLWMEAMTSGQVAYMQGDIPAARAAYRHAATLRDQPTPALVALAKIEAREGKLLEAEKALLRLRDLSPNHPDIHNELANLYRDQGRWKDSLVEWEAIHRFYPEKTWIYPQLGRAHLENGDARKAVEVLSGYPPHLYDNDPITEYYLGDALRRTGQIEKGERYLRAYEERLRKMAATDKTARSHNNLAWFLFEEGRSLDDALEMALKAVEKDPSNQYYLGTLGCVYYQLGRYKEAMERLEKALERHVSKADAATDLYFAAMTALKLGPSPDIARKYLKMAEEADPRNRYLAMARRSVDAPRAVRSPEAGERDLGIQPGLRPGPRSLPRAAVSPRAAASSSPAAKLSPR